MQPFTTFYLWLLAPFVFLTVMLYGAARFGTDKRNRVVKKDRGIIGQSGMRRETEK